MTLDAITRKRRENALSDWQESMSKLLALKGAEEGWKVQWDADIWRALGTGHRFGQLKQLLDKKGLDESLLIVCRCVVAQQLVGVKKTTRNRILAIRFLVNAGATDAYSLRHEHFEQAQDLVKEKGGDVGTTNQMIAALRQCHGALEAQGLVDFHWSAQPRPLPSQTQGARKQKNTKDWFVSPSGYTNVDYRIFAFTELLQRALADGEKPPHEREFSPQQEMAIYIYMLKMCAPARINEVLCMQTDDVVKQEHYSENPFDHFKLGSDEPEANTQGDENNAMYELHRAQQRFQERLLVVQKGSKGAKYSAKPVLEHMIDLCQLAHTRLLKLGEQSRIRAAHYDKHPDELYFPPGTEHLKDKSDLTAVEIARIIYPNKPLPANAEERDADRKKVVEFMTQKDRDESGKKNTKSDLPAMAVGKKRRCTVSDSGREVTVYDAEQVKAYLLARVKKSINTVRQVTTHNRYEGPLAKMLCLTEHLFDNDLVFGAMNAEKLAGVFKTGTRKTPNIFKQFNIKMLQGDEGGMRWVDAWIDSHDFRKFLTDNALESRKQGVGLSLISGLLINGWANRKDLAQLEFYRRDHHLREAKELGAIQPEHRTKTVQKLGLVDTILQDEEYDLAIREKANTHQIQTFTFKTASGDITVATAQSLDEALVGKDRQGRLRTLAPMSHGVCMTSALTPCQHFVAHGGCLPCNQRAYIKGDERRFTEVQFLHKQGLNYIHRRLEAMADLARSGEITATEAGTLLPSFINKDFDARSLTTKLLEEFEANYESIKDAFKDDRTFFDELEKTYIAHRNIQFERDPKSAAGHMQIYNGKNYHEIQSEMVDKAMNLEEKTKALTEKLTEKLGKVDWLLGLDKPLGLPNEAGNDSTKEDAA